MASLFKLVVQHEVAMRLEFGTHENIFITPIDSPRSQFLNQVVMEGGVVGGSTVVVGGSKNGEWAAFCGDRSCILIPLGRNKEEGWRKKSVDFHCIQENPMIKIFNEKQFSAFNPNALRRFANDFMNYNIEDVLVAGDESEVQESFENRFKRYGLTTDFSEAILKTEVQLVGPIILPVDIKVLMKLVITAFLAKEKGKRQIGL